MQTAPVILTPAEATLLGALLGAEVLPGVPDPFLGLLADEAEALLAEARASLIARGLLKEGDPPIAHLAVGLMVGALCFPQSSLRLTVIIGETRLVTWFHLTRNLSVSITAIGEPPVCLLRAHPGAQAVTATILEWLDGATASLERLGGGALQIDGAELRIDGPAGIEQQAATAEAVAAAVKALVEAAWPREEAAAG